MKISHVDRGTCRIIMEQLGETIRAFAESKGLVASIRSINFTDQTIACITEFRVADGSGKSPKQIDAENDFKMGGHRIPLDCLGKEFFQGNKLFKLVGMSRRSWKRPFICFDSQGREYRFSEQALRIAFKLND